MTEAYGAIYTTVRGTRGATWTNKNVKNKPNLFVERGSVLGRVLFVIFLVVPAAVDPFQMILARDHARVKLGTGCGNGIRTLAERDYKTRMDEQKRKSFFVLESAIYHNISGVTPYANRIVIDLLAIRN